MGLDIYLYYLKNSSKGMGQFSLAFVLKAFLAVSFGIIILAGFLPIMLGLEDFGWCSGPFKGLASVIADMTGQDMC